MNKKVLLGLVAVLCGLLFYCPKAYACYGEYEAMEDGYELPTAGIDQFLNDIEPVEPKPERILPHYILTDEDADLLLRIGVLEGGATDVDGIANVMQVVLNRLESDAFPNTISGVLYQEGQFTTAKRMSKAEITPEAYQALDNVIFGEYLDNEGLFFESLEGKVWADCHTYLFSYGGHDFYN